jgi:nucleotide-binding universal stress UspA family protein
MTERILCPIDFTLFSHHAIDYAVALGRSCRSTITALHVVPEPATTSATRNCVAQSLTMEDVEWLKSQALRMLQEAGAPSGGAVVVRGDPSAQILRVAVSLPADLIVMASHGRTGFSGTMCGSVTTDVLRHAPCPVLTVPRTSSVPDGHTLFRRILCAVDFSPASLRALRRVMKLAAAHDSRVVVLHVSDSKVTSEVVTVGVSATGRTDRVPAGMWQRRLQEAVWAEGPSAVLVTERVSEGDPANEILRMAEAEGCDLIAMGGHQGNPLNCTLNKVVRQSKCAVLTVRA